MSAKRILYARRARKLEHEDLRKMGVVMKRAQYFITCSGRMLPGLRFSRDSVYRRLAGLEQAELGGEGWRQLSLFGGDVG